MIPGREAEEAPPSPEPPDRLADLEQARARALQRIDPSLTWGEALSLAAELPVPRQAR